MPDLLRKIPFTEKRLPDVAGFDCGDEEWERPMASWITAGPTVKNGALYEMQKGAKKGRPLEVWLYINGGNELIGYSSLGPSGWEWPTATDQRMPINVIPYVAIQKKFWGKPEDHPRYAAQILGDIISEARKHTERKPLLGLYVDPRNVRAIRAYEKVGFQRFYRTYPDNGIEYISMLLKLAEAPPAVVG